MGSLEPGNYGRVRQTEKSEWWLLSTAIVVTVFLTIGLVSFALPVLREGSENWELAIAVRGLVGLVFLFDVYVVYQQLQIQRMRRRLLEGQELFQLITENAADMIAVVAANGDRLYNSPSYGRILGYSPDKLLGTQGFDEIHPDDRQKVIEAAEEARRTGVGRRIEYRIQHQDGHWEYVESTASAVRNVQGEVEKLVVVNRAIGERRRLEEQLRQVQKMDAIGRLSGGVAHDFNNLLGVIIGYGEVLRDGISEKDPLRSSIDQILKAGHRAASLTRQLLAFSRQQVLEPRVLILNSVVSDMEKMLRRLIGEDIELNISLDPTAAKIKADQGQIEQVIMNLIVNARDAMPEGGRLTIETGTIEMDEEFVKRYPYPVLTGPYVLLTVSDTGIGMDAGTQQRIFEPFFTTKEKGKGTGLGLSTVYGVVKQSGGYIDVRSSPGTGTTFQIYIPKIKQATPLQAQNRDIDSPLHGTETILLVEDEAALRTITRSHLEHLGYFVMEAENGREALEKSRKHSDPIHILLTDMIMPELSGHALAEELGRLRPEIRVIYMSGYSGRTYNSQSDLDPGSFFLQKPFTRDNLARKIREVLAVSGVASDPQAS